MKIELISPGWKEPSLWSIATFRYPPLSLPALAALTPSEYKVSITDEKVSTINFEKDVDLVAITAMTALAPRAYEIADRFRQRGVKVVLGGLHPSALPEEASRHADAVVIGEAEDIWQGLIRDFKNGVLRKYYKNDLPPSIENIPIPRRDLLKKKAYFMTNTVYTTRGCPHNCEFCTVTSFFGQKHRSRPVEDVIKEIETLSGKNVMFVDDNVLGNPNYAKKLLQALIPYKIKWISQTSLNMADNHELMQLCVKSGCVGLIIGIESISQTSLEIMGKPINKVHKYKEWIKKMHDHGIGIDASMVFGFDGDDKTIFERTVEFVQETNIDACQFAILTPLPGTRLLERLEKEGRIFERDWSKYDQTHIVFQPKHMSPEELMDGYYWTYRQVYSFPSIFKRLWGSKTNPLLFLLFNLGLRRASKLFSKAQKLNN